MRSKTTLTTARRPKEAGASEPMHLATKADLVGLRGDLRAGIAEVETRLIKWVIGTGVAAVIALSGVVWAATQVILHALP